MHTCHGSGSGTVRQWGVWPRTIRLASLRALFASECHVSRNANRNALAHPPPSPHALGTFPGAHQRTAQPSGESGRSGARARPRRPRANLIGECSNFFSPSGALSFLVPSPLYTSDTRKLRLQKVDVLASAAGTKSLTHPITQFKGDRAARNTV